MQGLNGVAKGRIGGAAVASLRRADGSGVVTGLDLQTGLPESNASERAEDDDAPNRITTR